jgi:ABC-type transport system involved in multi-copper enzyme maturation permease subunit
MQGFTRTLSLGEAIASNWANIAVLGVGLIVCFAASYMLFLRIEIRPGD